MPYSNKAASLQPQKQKFWREWQKHASLFFNFLWLSESLDSLLPTSRWITEHVVHTFVIGEKYINLYYSTRLADGEKFQLTWKIFLEDIQDIMSFHSHKCQNKLFKCQVGLPVFNTFKQKFSWTVTVFCRLKDFAFLLRNFKLLCKMSPVRGRRIFI